MRKRRKEDQGGETGGGNMGRRMRIILEEEVKRGREEEVRGKWRSSRGRRMEKRGEEESGGGEWKWTRDKERGGWSDWQQRHCLVLVQSLPGLVRWMKWIVRPKGCSDRKQMFCSLSLISSPIKKSPDYGPSDSGEDVSLWKIIKWSEHRWTYSLHVYLVIIYPWCDITGINHPKLMEMSLSLLFFTVSISATLVHAHTHTRTHAHTYILYRHTHTHTHKQKTIRLSWITKVGIREDTDKDRISIHQWLQHSAYACLLIAAGKHTMCVLYSRRVWGDCCYH